MIRSIFLSILILSIVSFQSPNNCALSKRQQQTINKTILLNLINQARQNGVTCSGKYYAPVEPVKWNDLLESAAKNHSKDMNAKKYFSHIGTDGSDAGARIQAAGYEWTNFAENIGMGYRNEEEVMDGWLHSPSHCKNIMNKAYHEIGIANVNGYWTLDFGSRN
jgi:uncharacterized protein YkwD